MAKFLFCIPRYHTNIVPWVRVLTDNGHDVSVHAITKGATENYELAQPLVVTESRLSSFLKRLQHDKGVNDARAFPEFSKYWRILAAENPDVVIVRGIRRNFCRMAILCAVLQRRRVVIYDQEDVSVRRWSRTWVRRSIFSLFGMPQVTARIPLGFEMTTFGTALSIPFACPPTASNDRHENRPLSWPPKILMVAKYRERKGHLALLEGLSKISTNFPLEITFCGENVSNADQEYKNILVEKAEELVLTNYVTFLENVDNAEMHEVYRRHDLFVFPSSSEPAAIAPVEAVWHGCAVLVSRDLGTRSYFPSDGRYDFDQTNPSDIASTLECHLESKEALQAVRNACFSHIRTHCNDDLVLRRFESLIPRTR